MCGEGGAGEEGWDYGYIVKLELLGFLKDCTKFQEEERCQG